MTLVDIMALAVGVALAFAARPSAATYSLAIPPARVLMVLSVAWFLGMAALAVSVVVAARLFRYDRGPRPAEWLAILTTLALLQEVSPALPIDWAVFQLPSPILESLETLAAHRWLMGGLSMIFVLGGLGLLRLGRSRLPTWLRSAGLVLVAGLAMAGPIAAFGLQGPDLLAPSGGFGPGPLSALDWFARQWVAKVPFGLFVGIPAMAGLMERIRRRPWRWTEWAGSVLPMVLLLVLSPLYQGPFPRPNLWWAAERGILVAWFLGVGLLSRFLVVRLGPWWSRGWGDRSVAGAS